MSVIVLKTLKEFNAWRTKQSGCVGLVPTMGNLHAAHISLLERSILENDVSIMTIFVNPKQFGKNEDLDKYPRTLKEDINKVKKLVEKLKATDKETIIFAPKDNHVIYPKGYSTTISIDGISTELEGVVRPTHFSGVSTVVYRLFQVCKPTNAYFGEKDYQQLIIIKKMVKDLEMGINIIPMPIGREKTGLAMSSRNQYLKGKEKQEALNLSKAIHKVSRVLKQKGILAAKEECERIKSKNKSFNYLELRNANSFNQINKSTKDIVIVGNYQIRQTRLLDNKVISL
jgi:pantoate--beta-alanine ligase